MGRQWPGPEIPTGGTLLPKDIYDLTIESIEETRANAGTLMYKGTFRVVEPAAFAGSPYWENFNIGSADDPNAEDPETWKRSIGAQILGRVIDAALVPRSNDVDTDIAAATGQRILASIEQEIETKEGPYKGRVRNKVVRWYKRGEAAVGSAGAPAAAPRATTPKPATPAAPKAAPKPVAPPAVSCSIEGCAWKGERRDFPAHVQAAHATEDE